MSACLIYKTLSVWNIVYKKLLPYQFPIEWNPKKNLLQFSRTQTISSGLFCYIFVFSFQIISASYLLLSYIHGNMYLMPTYAVIAYLPLLGFSLLYIIFLHISILQGGIICSYFNNLSSLQTFQKHLNTPRYSNNPLEILKDVKNPDKTLELVAAGVGAGVSILGIFGGPVIVLSNLDPLYFLQTRYINYSSWTFQLLFITLRTFLMSWTLIEAMRCYSFFDIFSLVSINMSVKIVRSLVNCAFSPYAFMKYIKVQCCNKIGSDVIQVITTGYMFGGATYMLGGNLVMLLCYHIINTEIYFWFITLNFIVYTFFKVGTQIVVECDIVSKQVMEEFLESLMMVNGHKAYWKRKVKALKEISFYYGLAKFDQQTQINFFENLLEATLNLVLLLTSVKLGL